MSSNDREWRRCREVETGRIFWLHTATNATSYTEPPSVKHKRMKSRQKSTGLAPKPSLSANRRSIDETAEPRKSSSNSDSENHQHRRHNNKNSGNHTDLLCKQQSTTPPPPTHCYSHSAKDEVAYRISIGDVPANEISHKPSPPKQPRKRKWLFSRKKNRRSATEGNIEWEPPKFTHSHSEQSGATFTKSSTLPSYKIISDHFTSSSSAASASVPAAVAGSKSNSKLKRAHAKNGKNGKSKKRVRSNTTATTATLARHSNNLSVLSASLSTTMDSKYDIVPNASIETILNELMGYDMLDLQDAMENNVYIKSNIDAILSYRYHSLQLSHIKQFQPPLNDALKELVYFRNIAYPSYALDTNLKITQIINQNIYDNQTPYLRIRIPLHIIRDVFGNQNLLNKNKSIKLSKLLGSKHEDMMESNTQHDHVHHEIFNIELSPKQENILNTTVQQFFHTLIKQTSGIKDDAYIEQLFLRNVKQTQHDNQGDNDEEDGDENHDSMLLTAPDMFDASAPCSLSPSSAGSTSNSESVNESVSGNEAEVDEHSILQYDWSKIAIKANGLEEYIFYSTNPKHKICNFECVRYALSHQLDKDDNQCFLTLVYLEEFDEIIEKLKKDYVAYEEHLNLWRTNTKTICETKQQFKIAHPWLNVINKQFHGYPKRKALCFSECKDTENDESSMYGNKSHAEIADIDYVKMNDTIYEWKRLYDGQHPQNNIVLLNQYKCPFEYTIHSIINSMKLPRFNPQKHESIILSFELQIGNLSYEQDIWLTPPKLSNKMEFTKAIYKSKTLKINSLPREIILSVIVFGIPASTSETDIYSSIYSARSEANLPSWFPEKDGVVNFDASLSELDVNTNGNHNNNNNGNGYNTIGSNTTSRSQSPNLILKEEPIDMYRFHSTPQSVGNNGPDNDMDECKLSATPSTRRRQYSYGSASDKDGNNNYIDVENDDNFRDYQGVFHRAFSKCDALAYLRIPLVDEFHVYRQGSFTFNLWDIPKWTKTKHSPRDPYDHDLAWRFIQPCSFPPIHNSNHNKTTSKGINECQITITIGPNPDNNPDYMPPTAIAPLFNDLMDTNAKSYEQNVQKPRQKFSAKEYKKMDLIVRRDPLTKLTKKERLLIWVARDKLSKTKPRALPVFLSCVDWRNEYHRNEAYRYLYKWKLPNLLSDLIELLASWNFPDNRIKHYVITQALSKLSDIELKHVLLQLVQIIKLEPHNTSFTSNFLIQRALRCVTRIGHYLYWYLKTEIDASYTTYTRFSLILEDFLVHCFSYSYKLYIQTKCVDGLRQVSNIVRQGKINKTPVDELKARMQNILRRMNKTFSKLDKFTSVSIPLNPKYKLKQFNISKCKYMGSAQAPLWLVCEPTDIYAKDVYVLFKSGDDLRQDLLTLQIMETMNQLWLISGYCMRLRIYKVIPTGRESGFVEIVTNSRTFNDIAVNLGGGVVAGPQDETVHVKYLKNTHPSKHNVKLREAAQDRYLRSTAGYCIASWILGIGDRHSDNIMIHECGDLFHIDFGHFLGNFKVKKISLFKVCSTEWQRERSPFVFLPAMKYCIKYDFHVDKPGVKEDEKNENYQRFVNLCTTAMDAIRRRHRLLLTLFSLMIPSQMPELLKESDIYYMRKQMGLQQHLNESSAAKTANYDEVRQLVINELNDSFKDGVRIFDHVIHSIVHSK